MIGNQLSTIKYYSFISKNRRFIEKYILYVQVWTMTMFALINNDGSLWYDCKTENNETLRAGTKLDKRSIGRERINIPYLWCMRRRNLGRLAPVAPQLGDRELEADLDHRRYRPSSRSCRKCAPRHEIHPCRRGIWPPERYHLVPSRCTGQTRCFLRKGMSTNERKPRNWFLNL